MRQFKLFAVLFAVLSICSLPGSVVAKDSSNPSQQNTCDPLKATGITKGLYGLCVAYCQAGAKSESVLDNYKRKATASDLPMPCLDVAEPQECPCWSNALVGEVNLLIDGSQLCATDVPQPPDGVDVELQGFWQVSMLLIAAGESGSCLSFVTRDDGSFSDLYGPNLSPEQMDGCVTGLENLHLAPACP